MDRWARALYQPSLPLEGETRVTASKEHITLSKEAAKEGMVLIKNETNLLPLKKGTRVALLGAGTFDYVKGGGGSGDVYTSHVTDFYEGLKSLNHCEIFEPACEFYKECVQKQYDEGVEPGMIEEPVVPEKLLDEAATFADTAIVTISRFSGEGWDRSEVTADDDTICVWKEFENREDALVESMAEDNLARSKRLFPKRDFYLNAAEEQIIEEAKRRFENVVLVYNVGGVMDLSPAKDALVKAVLYAWQGGMEGGRATAELLCGMGNPSGKLPDTFAASLEDYPSTEGFHESGRYVEYTEDIFVGYRYFETFPEAREKVLYPFGYGLSYTEFMLTNAKEELDALKDAGKVTPDTEGKVSVTVKNTGNFAGKEVVQLYVSAPLGKLGKAAKVLIAFAKTKCLQPGEEETLTLTFQASTLASYDDEGVICNHASVLEKGDYKFFLGTSVRDGETLKEELSLKEDIVLEKLHGYALPGVEFERLRADGTYKKLTNVTTVPARTNVLEQMQPGFEECFMPEERFVPIRRMPNLCSNAKLMDVVNGKVTLDAFVDALDKDTLISLLGGQPNTGVANTWGFGNQPEYGIPSFMTADGPAGLRLGEYCGVKTTAWPCSTNLAATWNTKLIEQVGTAAAKEVKENNIYIWLAPAVNIHRNPMCGRNFEYYSEDPVLTGKMGASIVKGIQSQHISPAVKHFACNNKEVNRKHSDSRVSERALREIYLKGFEIIVKEAKPWTIMSSYNILNGVRVSENKDLLTGILRDEWGYEGVVCSDWWTRGEHYKEILAGNDIKMAVGYRERVKEAEELGAVSTEDYKKCVKRVLRLFLNFD